MRLESITCEDCQVLVLFDMETDLLLSIDSKALRHFYADTVQCTGWRW